MSVMSRAAVKFCIREQNARMLMLEDRLLCGKNTLRIPSIRYSQRKGSSSKDELGVSFPVSKSRRNLACIFRFFIFLNVVRRKIPTKSNVRDQSRNRHPNGNVPSSIEDGEHLQYGKRREEDQAEKIHIPDR